MVQFFLPVGHAGTFPVLHASKACEYILLCLVTTFFWFTVCWLLVFLKSTPGPVCQIFWGDRWGRCQQTGVLLHNSLCLSCWAKTSIQQAFSTLRLSLFQLCVLLLEQTTTLPESFKNPSCHLRFFIPFHWVGCQNWFLVDLLQCPFLHCYGAFPPWSGKHRAKDQVNSNLSPKS